MSRPQKYPNPTMTTDQLRARDDIERIDVDGIELHSKTRLKIKVKSWTTTAAWKWAANSETCGICFADFESTCPTCRIPGEECPIIEGRCRHEFHRHCMDKWCQSNPTTNTSPLPSCPLCRQTWCDKRTQIGNMSTAMKEAIVRIEGSGTVPNSQDNMHTPLNARSTMATSTSMRAARLPALSTDSLQGVVTPIAMEQLRHQLEITAPSTNMPRDFLTDEHM